MQLWADKEKDKEKITDNLCANQGCAKWGPVAKVGLRKVQFDPPDDLSWWKKKKRNWLQIIIL